MFISWASWRRDHLRASRISLMRRDRFITRTVLHERKIFATFICNYFQICHNPFMVIEDHSQIHRRYCALTNRDMVLDTGVHFRWNLWKSKGWTEADLALVVAFIKGRMRTGRRFVESLRLNNLIDPDRFSEDLCDARAEQRVHKPTFRDRVMEGRPKQGVKETVRTPAQILAAAKAFADFRAWKEANL